MGNGPLAMTEGMRSRVAKVDATRADLGFPPYGSRMYRKIDIYAKLANGGLYYLASTNWARSCKEAREIYALVQPRAGYAATDLSAFYSRR